MLADAYAELERFPEAEAIAQWSEYVREAMERAETKNTADGGTRLFVDPGFAKDILSWDRVRDKTFTMGTTSDALKSIGVKDNKIIMHSAKVNDILNNPEHDMDIYAISRIPEVLETPIAVLKSKGVTKKNKKYNDGNTSRIVIFGELEDAQGIPMAVVLELMPIGNGKIMELSVVASAYGKDSNLSGFV